MNFSLPELHMSIEASVRQFATTQVAPHAHAIEAGGDAFEKVYAALGELDLGDLLVPEEDGGLGLDPLALVLVVQTLAEVSPSLSWALALHAGPATIAQLRSGCERPADRMTYGGFAPRSVSLWVMGDQVFDAAQLTVDAVDPMGLRGAGFATATARGAPQATLTATDHAACERIERLVRAAALVGCARGALRAALDYAQEREQFGRPIARFQAIQWKLADGAMYCDAAELMTRAAATSDRPHDAAAALAFASRVSVEVASEALQVHGGYGYTTEFPVERLLRGARMLAGSDAARGDVAEAVVRGERLRA